LSPLPGSDRILRQTNVIIRPRAGIDGVSASSLRVSAAGSLSGRHEGEVRTSDDGRTVTFHPDSPFEAGEPVALRVPGSSAMTGPSYELSSEIAGRERDALRDAGDPETEEGVQAASVAPPGARAPPRASGSLDSAPAGEPLPPGFPVIHVDALGGVTAP